MNLLLVAILGMWMVSCQRDEGFTSPSDGRNLRPLGTYVGRAGGGDSASLLRLINLAHPKVTVLWRGVGLRDKLLSSKQASIDAKPPFAFSLNLLQPPDQEVSEATDIAFGILCLFSDENGNGEFDRLIDPGMIPRYAEIDSLSSALSTAHGDLLAVSVLKKRLPEAERFYLDPSGALIRDEDGRPDTLTVLSLAGESEAQIKDDVVTYLQYCQRILANQNRWERFFAVRKKDNEFYYKFTPAPGHYTQIDIRFDRALFPGPGQEAEFDARLKKSVRATVTLYARSGRILNTAFANGSLDYPFTGYGIPGQDWMAGRAILDLLVFLRSQATLDTLLEASLSSSFRFSHLDRLHPGFNLFRCDDQYNCDVRAPGDSIIVYLGTSEAFFNPPGSPSRNPTPKSSESRPGPSAESFASWQGRYASNGSDTVSLVVRNGELWCESLGLGLLRVLPFDSLGFASPILDFQGVMTRRTSDSLPDRFVQYSHSSRKVALSLGMPVKQSVLDRIDSAARFTRAALPDSLLRMCAGDYDYGKDTLRVAYAGGDSLRVTLPGFSSLAFYAVNDSLFKCPWGEISLEFQGADKGAYRRVVFANYSQRIVVPVLNAAPSNIVKSLSAEETGVQWISGNQGSGKDSYFGVDGQSRYGCSQDGTYLQSGDGYVAGFSRSNWDDAISMRQGGDFITFRLPGMKGKIAVLELRTCAERSAETRRTRISIWAGADSTEEKLQYGDHQWMTAGASGAWWTLDSLVIGSDPYYLTLKQEDTRDAPFPKAFDGYRLGLRP